MGAKLSSDIRRIAKSLLAGDSNIKAVVELLNQYDALSIDDADYDKKREGIKEQAMKLKRGFADDYVEFIVKYLKKSSNSNPAMVALGSLDFNIDDAASKKYLGKESGFISKLNQKLFSGSRIGMKPLFKKAFDKAYGQGVFEEALKNNKTSKR